MTTTAAVDQVFLLIIAISVALLLLVTGLMLWFVVRYRRSRHPQAEEVKGSTALEVAWTLIPTLLVLVMFWYGYKGFEFLRRPPPGSLEVTVTGRMWDWGFEYANGKKSEKLFVPLGRPVKVNLRSVDVIHSFYVPAFRVKEDAVPGQESYLWFKPQSMGPADIFCAEFCGERHAYMISQVIVMEPAEFERWLAAPSPTEMSGTEAPSAADAAREVMEEWGCFACHSTDGTESVGPTLKGIWGRTVTVIAGGQVYELKSDEAYLRKALLKPSDELVKGYDDLMPPSELTDEQMSILLEYLKIL
jgi:cytochrome c oxidase subunit 2